MRLYRLFFIVFTSGFSGFSYADLPYCENVFNGVLNTTGGKVELWNSSKVIGSVDLNSTTISGGGANCYSSGGGAAYSCTANGTLSQVVSYTVPPLPSIPPAAGAANGTLDRSSGNPALTVASSGNYSGMNLNGYGGVVSVTFDGRAAPIVVNIAGSVGLGGNVRVNILGDVTIVANGYNSNGSPEVVVSQGASLKLKSRGDIRFSNGLELNMQGSSSSVNVYARNDFSLPNDTVMRGRVAAGGNIELSGTASIVGPVSAAGNISMSSSSTIRGEVMLGGHLAVSGDARIDGNLWAGSVEMSGGSKVTGVAAVSGSFFGHNKSIFTGALVAHSVTLTGSAQAILSEGLDYTGFCRDDAVVEFDHLRLFHTGGGQAVSCMATEIRVLACANEDCTEVFPGPASFPLGSSRGGFANHTVAIDESGQGRTFLSNPNGGLSTISSSVPLVCSFPGCSIDFKDSALFISNKANSLEAIPAQIAGKPFYAYLHAISTEPETKACEARVEGSKSVGFSFSCVDPGPDSCVSGQEYSIGGDPVPGDRTVKFDGNGVSDELKMIYTDAGKVKIQATLSLPKAGDNPAVVLEGFAEFVSRPFGLCLEADLKHDEELLFKGKDGGEPIHSAGDDFDLRIRAVAWREDAESIDDMREAEAICGNPLLLNYRQYFDEEAGEESIKLEAVLIDPELEGGAPEITLGRTTHDHTDYGQMTLPDQSVSEVGIFMIKAIPPEYLGADMTHAISLSSRIGRFVPAYLAIEKSIDLEPSCSKAEYSYQEQPIFFNESARLHVIGKNRQGETTLNYDRGEFWRFGGLSKHKMFSATDIDALDRKVRDGDIECQAADYRNCWAKRLADDSSLAALTDDVVGDGQRSYSLNGSVTYLRRAIELDKYDAPFEAAVRLFIDREDLSDQDDVTHSLDGESLSADYLSEPIQGSQVRLGRVRAENVIASDIPAPPRANLPLWLEQWDGNFFNPEDDQGCTTFESNPVESDYKGNLKMVDVDRQFSAEKEKQQEGVGIQAITGTENRFDGSALIEHIIKGPAGTAPLWLCQSHKSGLGGICSYYKSEDISRAMAQVTFGIYQGPKPLIFRRELYRGMQ